jgi:hypothetical protein
MAAGVRHALVVNGLAQYMCVLDYRPLRLSFAGTYGAQTRH